MPIINQGFDYQEEFIYSTFTQWQQGVKNVCGVAPTGAGKTIIKALTSKYFNHQHPNKNIILFAHRDILLSQISLAVAKVGLPHRMICNRTTERQIGQLHLDEINESYLHANSRVIVASVPTWIKRNVAPIESNAGLWLMDETHHLCRDNMWGRAVENMQHAYGLGVTATPLRSDGKGLGRHASGVFDTIVSAPSMGELIQRGKLSPYKVYTVPTKLNYQHIKVTNGGDYNQIQLAEATDKSEITGDAVEHYRIYAHNKQGIIFAASVGHAEHVAEDFRKAGYNAVALSSKTPLLERQHKINEFRKGRIQLLVNYDLFGEGFDVPAVEVVIMLRKTLSYGLFKQMFGRCLRVLNGKLYGILIDHVNNVQEHCLPGKHLHDDPEWSLDDVKRGGYNVDSEEEEIISRVCPECYYFYFPESKNYKDFVCPECGHAETKVERVQTQSKIQSNDGVLMEWDTGFLQEVIAEKEKVELSVEQFAKINQKLPSIAKHSAIKHHQARREAQTLLRPAIIEWCMQTANAKGLDTESTQKEFERVFGVNIFKAQAFGHNKAMDLLSKLTVL